MNNLSFHITDITANSIRANASEIGLSVEEQDTRIVIRITDNGSGMDAETARRVTNPFYTTRTTRKVGLGLPFLIQNAEQTGGSVTPDIRAGKGNGSEGCLSFGSYRLPALGRSSGYSRLVDHRQSGNKRLL